MNDDLKNSLWSVLTIFYWNTFDKSRSDTTGYSRRDYISGSNLEELFHFLWLDFFKKPIDTQPNMYYGKDGGREFLRNYFFNAEWFKIYDFIEFIVLYNTKDSKDSFMRDCNKVLDRENSAYRFVNGVIVEISSVEEINEIEEAIRKSTPYWGVKKHLETATFMLSDKVSPDCRNSIKESISAVEGLCKIVSHVKKATLGDALKVFEEKKVIHPALKKAFLALYGYTSDADGIRHALMEESNLTSADARFMLISCSAFVNYVIANTSDEG